MASIKYIGNGSEEVKRLEGAMKLLLSHGISGFYDIDGEKLELVCTNDNSLNPVRVFPKIGKIEKVTFYDRKNTEVTEEDETVRFNLSQISLDGILCNFEFENKNRSKFTREYEIFYAPQTLFE